MSKKKRAKLKPDAWMPWYLGDYLRDTAHLTTEQHGAYMLLLGAMWTQGGRLLNDDQQLAAIARLPATRWRAHRRVLLAFFSEADGWLYQKRLTEEYEHAWAVYQKRVESGKQGGRPVERDLFDDTERGTERFTEREGESPPQPQPQPPSSPTTTESGKSVEVPAVDRARAVAAQNVCRALAAGGVECSTLDPHLVAALAEFSADEILALAKTRKGKGKGIAYLLSTLRGQRHDAQAAASEAPSAPAKPDPEVAALEAERQRWDDAIYDARHLHDTAKSIDTAERDRRIAEARRHLNRIHDQLEARRSCV